MECYLKPGVLYRGNISTNWRMLCLRVEKHSPCYWIDCILYDGKISYVRKWTYYEGHGYGRLWTAIEKEGI